MPSLVVRGIAVRSVNLLRLGGRISPPAAFMMRISHPHNKAERARTGRETIRFLHTSKQRSDIDNEYGVRRGCDGSFDRVPVRFPDETLKRIRRDHTEFARLEPRPRPRMADRHRAEYRRWWAGYGFNASASSCTWVSSCWVPQRICSLSSPFRRAVATVLIRFTE